RCRIWRSNCSSAPSTSTCSASRTCLPASLTGRPTSRSCGSCRTRRRAPVWKTAARRRRGRRAHGRGAGSGGGGKVSKTWGYVGLLVLAAATGCVTLPTNMSWASKGKAVAAPEKPKRPAPVSPDQVTEANAREVGMALRDELDRDAPGGGQEK